MNENKPIIAERIKTLRKEKKLTQEQLAELLGLNAKSSIANYESGANSPSDDIKEKMCKLFNCSIDYLMGNSFFKTYNDYHQAIKYSVSFLEFCKKKERKIVDQIMLKIMSSNNKELEYVNNLIASCLLECEISLSRAICIENVTKTLYEKECYSSEEFIDIYYKELELENRTEQKS